MTRKTYFLIAGIILVVMVTAFAIRINSQPEVYCHPSTDWQCLDDMISFCMDRNQENTGFWLFHSFCDGEYCVGVYKVYCDFAFTGYIACGYSTGYGCEGD